MAITVSVYTHAHKILLDGTVDWLTDGIKLALVDSGYTYSASHTQRSDFSTYEEADASYAVATLAGKTCTNTEMDANDVTYSSLSATFRYAILYANVTAGGLTDPVLSCFLLDDTPADVTVGGVDYTVTWNASGIFTT